MNKKEFLELLNQSKKEMNQEGKLSDETKALILKEKDSLLEELSEEEKIELYKLLQATNKKDNPTSVAQPSLRFGGRG
ncbi:MAG: hypothetical protein K2M84_03200, partial [Anaeroplasmataceae bacterium]|nr:hypothetical protein [Anaeroplasmataceae bacterium]